MTPRSVGQVVGLVIGLLGFSCLPVGQSANPKRQTSLFLQTADTGLWWKLGGILLLLGAAIYCLSFLLPDGK